MKKGSIEQEALGKKKKKQEKWSRISVNGGRLEPGADKEISP